MERGERPMTDDQALLTAYDRAARRCQRDPSAAALALLRTGEEILLRTPRDDMLDA